jgi:hypothetical protein
MTSVQMGVSIGLVIASTAVVVLANAYISKPTNTFDETQIGCEHGIVVYCSREYKDTEDVYIDILGEGD